ncbi:hypothetical protein N7462_004353 [Penicillium macrosclerotiorum]|uniref:uncharacterized protein n=1 Tax=Penicillium macrosclerotiorum TaxID=303699 RepID=UPI00254905F1|nr:uncharacterized protein N7462_004353 [Penicillium macrosclerotiorum]KAJ5689961.1 hypothetical protein N7462_004353 [Penicillium macrosclerotiorum]
MCLHAYHHYTRCGHIANWTVTSCFQFTNAIRAWAQTSTTQPCDNIRVVHDLLPVRVSSVDCFQCLNEHRGCFPHDQTALPHKYTVLEGLGAERPIMKIYVQMDRDQAYKPNHDPNSNNDDDDECPFAEISGEWCPACSFKDTKAPAPRQTTTYGAWEQMQDTHVSERAQVVFSGEATTSSTVPFKAPDAAGKPAGNALEHANYSDSSGWCPNLSDESSLMHPPDYVAWIRSLPTPNDSRPSLSSAPESEILDGEALPTSSGATEYPTLSPLLASLVWHVRRGRPPTPFPFSEAHYQHRQELEALLLAMAPTTEADPFELDMLHRAIFTLLGEESEK